MDISRRLLTALIMSSASAPASTLGSTFASFLLSFLALPSFFFSSVEKEILFKKMQLKVKLKVEF